MGHSVTGTGGHQSDPVQYPVAMLTGHRRLSPAQFAFVRAELVRIAIKLRDQHGTTTAISGMALGADTVWAEAILDAGLDLWAYLPFPQQADRWPEASREQWARLRAAAVREHVTADHFRVQALHARNADMVRDANVAIAVWSPSESKGGTAACVNVIRRRQLPLIVVDLDQLRTRWDHR